MYMCTAVSLGKYTQQKRYKTNTYFRFYEMKRTVSKVISRNFSTSKSLNSLQSSLPSGFYNNEQFALQESVKKLVEEVINPNWKQWQNDQIFPAKQVFKKFGDAGLLGIHRSSEFGGQGLSYKYNVAFLEAMGHSQR